MTVLYTFDAFQDGWDGTVAEEPPPPGAPWEKQCTDGAADISGYYDFHSHRWALCDYDAFDYNGNMAFLAFGYKQTANPEGGLVHRVTFKLSVTEWAHGTDGNAVLQWRSADTYDADPGNSYWNDRLSFHIDSSGHLSEVYTALSGTAVFASGALHDVSIAVTIDPGTQTKSYKAFVDGVLDFQGSIGCYVEEGDYPPAYAEIEAGYVWGTQAIHEQTVHIGDLIWTIETLAPAVGAWGMCVLWDANGTEPDFGMPWLPSDGRNHCEWNGHASRPATPRALPATRDFVPPDAIEFFATKVSDTLYTDLEQWSDHIELFTDSDGHVVMEVGDNPAATSSQTMVEDTVYDLNLSADVTGDTEVDTLKMNGEIWIEIENTADPKGFTEYSYVAATDDFDEAQVMMADVTMKMMEIITLSS